MKTDKKNYAAGITPSGQIAVNFNGIRWVVREAKLTELKDYTNFGFTDYVKHEICLNTKVCPQELESTYRRELAHASMYSHGFYYYESMNREQVAEWYGKCGEEIEFCLKETILAVYELWDRRQEEQKGENQ